jgi:hypothetical protein
MIPENPFLIILLHKGARTPPLFSRLVVFVRAVQGRIAASEEDANLMIWLQKTPEKSPA